MTCIRGTPRKSKAPAIPPANPPLSQASGDATAFQRSCSRNASLRSTREARRKMELEEVQLEIEALYKQRKSALRLLRRLDDSQSIGEDRRRPLGSRGSSSPRRCFPNDSPRYPVRSCSGSGSPTPKASDDSRGNRNAGPVVSCPGGNFILVDGSLSPDESFHEGPFCVSRSDGEQVSKAARLAMAGLAAAPRLSLQAVDCTTSLTAAGLTDVPKGSPSAPSSRSRSSGGKSSGGVVPTPPQVPRPDKPARRANR
mmetsp:Transcript_79216/g.164416  ORF Transcript_79216/g.164416 Transcript_79216/m.164416 type:complete len:255 (+) Transcript_79216:177-941(+)